eukprot:scaffold4510_cov183-Amphora_coffeaeformis.AAC.35
MYYATWNGRTGPLQLARGWVKSATGSWVLLCSHVRSHINREQKHVTAVRQLHSCSSSRRLGHFEWKETA